MMKSCFSNLATCTVVLIFVTGVSIEKLQYSNIVRNGRSVWRCKTFLDFILSAADFAGGERVMLNWFTNQSEKLGAHRHDRTNKSNKYTFDNFQRLTDQLLLYAADTQDLPDPTTYQETRLIESLRSLSEFLIYIDQHKPMSDSKRDGHAEDARMIIFDYFCEQNFMKFFVTLGGKTTSVRSIRVQIQLLQTLSIIFQNLTNPMTMYYLLSNDHINQLILSPVYHLQQSEEVRNWYVTFLKALSLRLNLDTVQFFFHHDREEFPLYRQALQFLDHPENMVQIAVRTLLLNVLKIKDDRMREFICVNEGGKLFTALAELAKILAFRLQKSAMTGGSSTFQSQKDRIQGSLDEFADYCYFLQDVFDLGISSISLQLEKTLFCQFFQDFILQSPCFVEEEDDSKSHSLREEKADVPVDGNGNGHKRLHSTTALYLLAQFFSMITYAPLLNAITTALFHPKYDHHHPQRRSYEDTLMFMSKAKKEDQLSMSQDQALSVENIGLSGVSTNIIRTRLEECQQSANDQLSFGSMFLMYSVMNHSDIDSSILRQAKLLSQRKENLLQLLLAKMDTSQKHSTNAQGPGPNFAPTQKEMNTSAEDSCVNKAQEEWNGKAEVNEKVLREAEEKYRDEKLEETQSKEKQGDKHIEPAIYSAHVVDILLTYVEKFPSLRLLNLKLVIRILLDLVLTPTPPRTSTSPMSYLTADHSNQVINLLQQSKSAVEYWMDDKEPHVKDCFVYYFDLQYGFIDQETFPLEIDSVFLSDPLLLMALKTKSQYSSTEAKILFQFRSVLETPKEKCQYAIARFFLLQKLVDKLQHGPSLVAQESIDRYQELKKKRRHVPPPVHESTLLAPRADELYLPCGFLFEQKADGQFLVNPSSRYYVIVNSEMLILLHQPSDLKSPRRSARVPKVAKVIQVIVYLEQILTISRAMAVTNTTPKARSQLKTFEEAPKPILQLDVQSESKIPGCQSVGQYIWRLLLSFQSASECLTVEERLVAAQRQHQDQQRAVIRELIQAYHLT